MFRPLFSKHEEAFWRTRLFAAFRTAFSCFLTGLVLEHGNINVKWVSFPIFAYVMAVTVVGESTFGKALEDTVAVLKGTILGIGMGTLVLHAVGTHRITLIVAMSCISLSSMVIVFPQRIPIVSKRVALAHSAILYLMASIKKAEMEAMRFSLQLAATTVAGAMCGMLAVLLPFPHLAISQVRSQLKLSTCVISERLRLMVDSFCGNDLTRASSLNLQARSLAQIGSSIDAAIIFKENDLMWEHPGFSEHFKYIMQGLKRLKQYLLGMELALASELNLELPRKFNYMMRDSLLPLTDWACLALRYGSQCGVKVSGHLQIIEDEGREALSLFSERLSNAASQDRANFNSDILKQDLEHVPIGKTIDHPIESLLLTKGAFHISAEAAFFLFNLERFVKETQAILHTSNAACLNRRRQGEISNCAEIHNITSCPTLHLPYELKSVCLKMDNQKLCKYCDNASCPSQEERHQKRFWWFQSKQGNRSKLLHSDLQTAVKISLAMGLAAFLGSWFQKSKGYWADIMLGLGFTGASTGSSFKVATQRAQGTVAGSIYGFLAIIATANFPLLRWILLIPWAILTSFLRETKTFGFSGAICAFVGAVVILTHNDKDLSDQSFTIVRIVEAFIGMSSFIIVELLVMPRRAAGIVKFELISGMRKLKSYLEQAFLILSESRCENCYKLTVLELRTQEVAVREVTTRMQDLIKEAVEEPQLWYSVFPAIIYSKLTITQNRVVDFMHICVCALETIVETFGNADILEEAVQSGITENMNVICRSRNFKNKVNDKEKLGKWKKRMMTRDEAQVASPNYMLQMRSSMKPNYFRELFEKSYGVLTTWFLHECTDIDGKKHMEDIKNALLLCVGTLEFSFCKLLQEASDLENGVRELLQFESPWKLIESWGFNTFLP
ncbi:hypothetical protein KP509_13G036300 [Ceratopteris richardii]|uniref:Integral membrane bound transporter domain-containing protein n=1 Tax=Ceratopteris richardii TaxID=49495 RepID=A0A8T2TGQ1_CERRI|nr:hypothetical protein KP509_13G036300 [Ceratopteris richardii]